MPLNAAARDHPKHTEREINSLLGGVSSLVIALTATTTDLDGWRDLDDHGGGHIRRFESSKRADADRAVSLTLLRERALEACFSRGRSRIR